jgi:hypothetical protein
MQNAPITCMHLGRFVASAIAAILFFFFFFFFAKSL